MKLQGRNLTTGLRGDDVKLLHSELKQLGFSIPGEELTGGLFGDATTKVVMRFQTSHQLKATGIVDEITATAINREVDALTPPAPPLIVKGQVRRSDGTLFNAGKVQAFDKDLRNEELLGEVALDARGAYEIRYTAAQFQRAEKQHADLIVRIIDAEKKILFASEIIFNALPVQTVDIVLENVAREPEFERYQAAMKPILDKVKPEELTDQDIDFIAGETRIPPHHIAWFAVAHQFATSTSVNPAIFYGLFRQNLPTSLLALLLQPRATLRAALESSIAQNIVTASLLKDIDSNIDSLINQRGKQLLNAKEEGAAVSGVLGLAGLKEVEQEAFLSSYLKHEGDVESFWTSLKGTPLEARALPLQRTLQLALVTRNNVPLIKELQSRKLQSVRDLARLQPEELKKLIVGSNEISAAIEAIEEGETSEQKASRFTEDLFEQLHEAIPTAFVQTALEKSTDAVRTSAARLLSRLPELELRDDNLEQTLRDNPKALDGIAQSEKVLGLLKRTQRTLRVASNAVHAQSIMDSGLDSALSITRMSPAAFEEQFAGKLGGALQAKTTYLRAKQVNDTVLAITSSIQQSLKDVLPGVIEQTPESVKALPNFSTLFGSQSLCSCEHCQSVLSPAAYLVDLLEFINPKSGPKPIAKLRSKRPDLEHILLTCDNTNTPLPYIDLVNEVLEFYVAQGALAASAAHNTVDMSAAELNASPQYIIDAAYAKLASAIFPLSLPYNRSLETTRVYLEHLGTSRDQLVRVFQANNPSAELEIACGLLKISARVREIVTGKLGHPLSECYGFPASQNPESLDSIRVADFLSRTSLTFEELQKLVQTRFLNESGSIQLTDEDNPPRCDLARMWLKPLTPSFWQKAHRFVRLQRLIGWSITDLDIVLTSLQMVDITDGTLIQLGAVKQLQARTQLPVTVLASFWGNLDSRFPDSIYQRLFINKTVLSIANQAVFQPGTPENTAAVLMDHVPYLLAALRLSASDLELLVQHLGLDDPATALSVANLSALHRYVALARALRLSLSDLISVRLLTDTHPFVVADPTSTVRFIEEVQRIEDSGFKMAQLNYLFRHTSEAANLLEPTQEVQLGVLRAIQLGLQSNATANATQTDPSVDPLASGLLAIVGESELDESLAVIYGTGPLYGNGPASSALRESFIRDHFAEFLNPDEAIAQLLDSTKTRQERQQYVSQQMVVHEQNGLVIRNCVEAFGLESRSMAFLLKSALHSVDVPNEPLLRSFFRLIDIEEPIPGSVDVGSELEATLQPLLFGFIRLHKASSLILGFGMNEPEVRFLSQHGVEFGGFDWNAMPLTDQDISANSLVAWRRLANLFALLRSFTQTTVDPVEIFLAAADGRRDDAVELLKQASGWASDEVDFLVGPDAFNLASASDFATEQKLVPLRACIELSQRLGVACRTLVEWSGAPSESKMADAVVAVTKAKYSDDRWLSIAKPLNDELRERQRSALVSFVLANDAAVKQAKINHSNQLFEYFLIDVEMSACAKTSRIKQAIASVQLFIQRCLMNLEDGVKASSIDVDRWEWMKSYRVWEANRKVFLYPENWIEPELRDDKSPFFREVESALLQNDLTWGTAEDAYVKYLESLHQVARLEPCGMVVEDPKEPGDDEIIHVFGRTQSTPRNYFYRRLINGRHWTPWEKLDQEIEGDHLIPVVRNRRLVLMWLTFEEKPDAVQELPHSYVQSPEHWRWFQEKTEWEIAHTKWRSEHAVWTARKALIEVLQKINGKPLAELEQFIKDEIGGEPAEPRAPEEPAFSTQPTLTHWEIRLAWMEYKDGRWSARRTSSEAVVSPHIAPTLYNWFLNDPDQTLHDFNEEHNIFPSLDTAPYKNTIFTIYLPEPEKHFARVVESQFRSQDNGEWTIGIYRRYRHSAIVTLGKRHKFPMEGYERLGTFHVHCGSKFDAISLKKPETIPFESLKRPDATTNSRMVFAYRGSEPSLSFTSTGKRRHVLRKGTSSFDVLYEHQQLEFRLKPPFQNFFYHDRSKTYFASYVSEEPGPVLRIPGRAIAVFPFNKESPLIGSIAKKTASQADSSKQSLTTTSLIGQGNKNLALAKSQRWEGDGRIDGFAMARQGIRFETFFHPHLCEWLERLYRDGLPGLLQRSSQQLNHAGAKGINLFDQLYDPAGIVVKPFPNERVDFDRGAYASYNWEVFFHLPMLIATSLSKNQRFEDAMQWFHFVFNPMTDDPSASRQRFWNLLPFYQNSNPEHEQIQNLLSTLAGKKSGWKEIESQIEQWRTNPFNPHLIARLRLTAYQKHVVMKYIDNILAWADQLFSRDTLESINEATLLYVLAWNVLGPRPQTVATHHPTAPKSYHDIAQQLDAFSNSLVEVENLIPYQASLSVMTTRSLVKSPGDKLTQKPKPGTSGTGGINTSAVHSLFFCVPRNQEMLRYWDAVEDRLFKIRHCMNIEGMARQLPLFEPPIDPALLVKAKAAGLDLGSVLNDLFASLPHYRFNVMLQKAMELCNELKSLGGALLSAIEKRDAEAVSNLRASQETSSLKAVRDLKRQQIDEAKVNLAALKQSRKVIEVRYSYYRDILQISEHERKQMDDLSTADALNLTSQVVQAASGVAVQFPNVTIGISGPFSSPVSTFTLGGSTVGAGLQSAASILSMIAGRYTFTASVASIVGGYARRWEDWKLQERLASRELEQIDKQITAAEIRQSITEKELENHEQQIANSQAVEQFLRSKFTNEELYNWMITQISKIYFQTYKVTYDLAKRTERTYRLELGIDNSDFIRFGYWDNLRKGLLAGEQLGLDLKRMDIAYLDRNKREYELTKHISLLQLDPMALVQLRETGRCEFQIPEWWFDLDSPGHYMRRIKNVSLSMPCVTGPYTSVNCTLSLHHCETRILPTAEGDYPRELNTEDSRFTDSFGPAQAIVTSGAQNDSGLFETNLHDERYLPFENAGVISKWQLQLPADPSKKEPMQFDYRTISDVVLHVRYTARDGGKPLRDKAIGHVKQVTHPPAAELNRLFSIRHEFPTEWAKFMNQLPEQGKRLALKLNLRNEHYPFWLQGRLQSIVSWRFIARSNREIAPGSILVAKNAVASGSDEAIATLKQNDPSYGSLFLDEGPVNSPSPLGEMNLFLDDNALSDLWILVSVKLT